MTVQTPSTTAVATPDAAATAAAHHHRCGHCAGCHRAYALSLFGVHVLQKSEGPLPPLDLSQAGADETVVQIRLEELKSTTNRLTVNVLIYPGESLEDKRFDELNTDIAVRLYPPNDLGDIKYPAGKAPAQVSTTIQAHGDPGDWPFDSYRTEPISADVFVGEGAERKRLPALVQVTGAMDGWDAASRATATPVRPEATTPATWWSPCTGPRGR